MMPVGHKWTLLGTLARQGALTDLTLRSLWSAEFAGFVSNLQLPACNFVAAGCLAQCLSGGAVRHLSPGGPHRAQEPGRASGATAGTTRSGIVRGHPDRGGASHGDTRGGCEGRHRIAAAAGAVAVQAAQDSGAWGWVRRVPQGAAEAAVAPPAAEPPPRPPPPQPPPHGPVALLTLGLHACHQLSDGDVWQLLPHCRSLTSLDLSGCHQLGNQAIAAVGSQLSGRLTSLDLSNCHLVSNLTPLQACRRLRCLRLAGCWRLAERGLAQGGAASLAAPVTAPAPASAAEAGPEAAAEPAAAQWARAPPATPRFATTPGTAHGPPRRAAESQVGALLRLLPGLQELDVSSIPGVSDVDLGGLWGGGDESGTEGAQRTTAVEPAFASAAFASAANTMRAGDWEQPGPPFSCRSSLTSVSLSATAISSEALPRLVAACPALVHIWVSRCPHVAGCAVLAAARIRGAQIQAGGAAAVGGAGSAAAGRGADTDARELRGFALDLGAPEVAFEPSLDGAPEPSAEAASAPGGSADPRATGWPAGGPSASVPPSQRAASDAEHQTAPAWPERPVPADALVGAQLAAAAAAPLGPHSALPARPSGAAVPAAAGAAAAAWRTLAAAELGRWEEEPEAVLGEELVARLAEQALRGTPLPLPLLPPGADGRWALGGAGMVEDLFDPGCGCGLATRQLTSLDLSGTSQFSDMSAARLASCCPGLASLALAACSRLSDEGLTHLAALTALTHLDLAGCAPAPGAARARTPGSAFRRPAAAEPSGPSWGGTAGGSAPSASAPAVKRPRRAGVTDSPGPGGAVDGARRGATTGALPVGESPPARTCAPWGAGPARLGLASLCLGGTEAGEATLRAVSGLSRLELQGCRGGSDWAVLQALEHCPDLQTLKLSGCAQLSPAALGYSGAPGPQWRSTPGDDAAARTASWPVAPGGGGGPSSAADGAPARAPAGNTRARALRKASLPGALASDAFLAWLLGVNGPAPSVLTAPPPSPATLWALRSLDLGPTPPSAKAGNASRGAAGGGGAAAAAAASGGGAGVTDALLVALPAACPLLHSLRLRGAGLVTDAGACAVLRGCRLLARFGLTGCPHLTDAALALALELAAGRPAGSEAAWRPCSPWGGGRAGVSGGGEAPDGAGVKVGGDAPDGADEEQVGDGPGSLLHLDLSGCGALRGARVLDSAPSCHPRAAGGTESNGGGGGGGDDHPLAAAAEPCGTGAAGAHGASPASVPPPPLLLLSLCLAGCRQLPGSALETLLRRCPHLRDLEAQLDAAALRVAAACCPNLRSLKVSAGAAAPIPASTAGRPAGGTSAAAQRTGMGGGGAMVTTGAAAGSGALVLSWPLAAAAGRPLDRPTGHLDGQRGSVAAAAATEGEVWLALTRLEVPVAMHRDAGLRLWAASRPHLQVAYV